MDAEGEHGQAGIGKLPAELALHRLVWSSVSDDDEEGPAGKTAKRFVQAITVGPSEQELEQDEGAATGLETPGASSQGRAFFAVELVRAEDDSAMLTVNRWHECGGDVRAAILSVAGGLVSREQHDHPDPWAAEVPQITRVTDEIVQRFVFGE